MNTNKHPERQIEVLAKLIKRNGVRLPVIISNLSSKCVSGHGRFDAFKLLGMEKVPVVYQDFDDVAAEYRFLESDNLIASFAEHDKEQMLDNLELLGFDTGAFDFTEVGLIDFEVPTILDIDEVGEVNTKENFIIVCESEIELADLRHKFNTSTNKVNYSKAMS